SVEQAAMEYPGNRESFADEALREASGLREMPTSRTLVAVSRAYARQPQFAPVRGERLGDFEPERLALGLGQFDCGGQPIGPSGGPPRQRPTKRLGFGQREGQEIESFGIDAVEKIPQRDGFLVKDAARIPRAARIGG